MLTMRPTSPQRRILKEFDFPEKPEYGSWMREEGFAEPLIRILHRYSPEEISSYRFLISIWGTGAARIKKRIFKFGAFEGSKALKQGYQLIINHLKANPNWLLGLRPGRVDELDSLLKSIRNNID